MNQMINALRNSRSEGPAAPPAAAPEAPAGDALAEKFAAMDSKLDQILKLLGAEQKEEAPENDGTEAPHNDDGY